VTRLFRKCMGAGLLLAASCATAAIAPAQDLAPAGSPSPGMHELPPKPSEPPDIHSKYMTDPLMLRALREQARLRGQARQKQLVDATNLLLKIAQDLRKEIASHPASDSTDVEKDRLEQIQKLARVIQDRERAEDDVSADLAKAGVWP
jgi:hypothetical protein